jgi:hypothetical protein
VPPQLFWGATAGVGLGYVLCQRTQRLGLPVAIAIVALVMATHGFNDLYGKYIGPLAIVLLDQPLPAHAGRPVL